MIDAAERQKLPLDSRDFSGKALGAGLGIDDGLLALPAVGGRHGEARREVGEGRLAFGEGRFRGAASGGGVRLPFCHCRVGGLEPGFLLVEAHEHGAVVGNHALLAGDILAELCKPPVKLAKAGGDARLLGVESFGSMFQPLQRGPGAGCLLAELRHGGSSLGLDARGGRLLGGAVVRIIGGGGSSGIRLGDRSGRVAPAQMQDGRLGLPDLAGKIAVAGRLPRLALQRFILLLDLRNYVVEAGEVLFSGAETQFRLVATTVEPGDAGGFLQQRAPVDRLGRDQLADLALSDNGRGVSAGGGVGEQELHVARPYVLAVDAIDRARLAFDAAGDLEKIGIVEGRRGGAVAVVDRQRHLGGVARRAVEAALEDHVVHAGRAHVLVGALAHHPAERLDEIRFAAAIGADNASEPRLDHEFGRLDEGLEAEEPQAIELHRDLSSTEKRWRGASKAPRHGAVSAAERRVECLKRLLSSELRTVDEESRRRVDAELAGRTVLHPVHSVQYLLIRQACLERLLCEAGLAHEIAERGRGVLHEGPLALVVEEEVDNRELTVGGRAAGDHDGGGGQRIERILAEQEAHLAGVDVLLFERIEDLGVEALAVRAGHGGVLDDHVRRVGIAERHFAERAGNHQRAALRRLGRRGARCRVSLDHHRILPVEEEVEGAGCNDDDGSYGDKQLP